jgi:hypothetical protein
MKTRRNHRKTTTGRRKRHVKQQRVQTRINHRKGTVSSGRRHKFFKRGGEPRGGEPFVNNQRTTLFNTDTSRTLGTYDGKGLRIPSWSQINIDKEEAAAKAAAEAAKPIEQNYPDVDAFVNKINAVYVSGFFGSECNLTIQKLPQISFSDRSVQNGEKKSHVIKTINQKTVEFYITFNGCNIDIYVDGTRYGRVVPVTANNVVIDTERMCSPLLRNAIELDLIAASAT